MDATSDRISRLGLHYFPDTLHYRQTDLRAWLPELRSLGVASLVLDAPDDRAIPEDFITGLCNAGIQPVPHFKLSPGLPRKAEDLTAIFDAYRRWGVREIVLYDRPNSRQAWPVTAWAQTDLVERFLAGFVPLAEAVAGMGMLPVFAPLEPGGDYWDTAFLRASLQSMQKMGKSSILEKLVLGAYAPSGDRPLDWGLGGPERWPGARPYYTPGEEQDQRGYFISDWYRTISQALLGEALPMMLFGAGSPGWTDNPPAQSKMTSQDIERTLNLIAQVEDAPRSAAVEMEAQDIVACHFWLLSAAADSPQAALAWYNPDGQTLALVGVLKQRNAQKLESSPPSVQAKPEQSLPPAAVGTGLAGIPSGGETNANEIQPDTPRSLHPALERHPISHYLLLPTNKDGLCDVQIDGIYAFIKKYNLTVGFSLDEAALAAQVTILDTGEGLPDHDLEYLRSLGSKVVCIRGSGTELAQFLTTF